MVKKSTIDKYIPLIVIVLAILGIPIGLSFVGQNPLSFFSFQSIAVPSGVTVTGLGQVAVQSNWQGVAGPWWLASVTIGGPQSLNIQNLGGATYSASTLNTNSSYTCGSACQQDNLQVTTLQSYLTYPAEGSGTGVPVYYVSYATAAQSLNYQTCVNGPLIGTSGMPNTTSSITSVVSFSGCSNGAAKNQSYVNYYKACHYQANGTPLQEAAGTSGLGFQWTIPWIYGKIITINNGATVGCYQLNSENYANIYGFSSGGQPQYTLKVTVNGQPSIITNNYTSQDNTSNPNLYLYNLGSAYTTAAAPSETTVSLIQYLPLTTTTGLSQPSHITNQQAAYTTLIEGNGGTGITGIISSCEQVIQGTGGTFSTAGTLAASIQDVNNTNNCIGGALVNSYVNTAFSNASIIYGSSSTSGFTSTKGPVIGVKLPDPTGTYVRPNFVILAKASFMGIYLGVSKFRINSVSIAGFKAGSSTTATVAIQNIGNAQGGYTLSFNSSASSAGLVSTPSGSGGTLSNVAGQNVTSVPFTIQDNSNIQQNTQSTLAYTVCPNPMVSGSTCSTVKSTFTLSPQCNVNVPVNESNCQPLTTVTAPTTTVPTTTSICQSPLGCGPTTTSTSVSVTTTIICNPETGSGCSAVCPLQPSVNASYYYNSTTKTYEQCPGSGGLTPLDIIIIVGFIVLIVIIAYYKKRK